MFHNLMNNQLRGGPRPVRLVCAAVMGTAAFGTGVAFGGGSLVATV